MKVSGKMHLHQNEGNILLYLLQMQSMLGTTIVKMPQHLSMKTLIVLIHTQITARSMKMIWTTVLS